MYAFLPSFGTGEETFFMLNLFQYQTFYFLYLSMLRYYVTDVYITINNITVIAQSNYNLLRWLLRRGSPLPIPNRVVKPACADGTAVLWESMSSPFFMKSLSGKMGFFIHTLSMYWYLSSDGRAMD